MNENVLQRYLDDNAVTRYKVSKVSGISQNTLVDAVKPTKRLENQSVKVISAVAKAINKTPGQVLDDLIQLNKID